MPAITATLTAISTAVTGWGGGARSDGCHGGLYREDGGFLGEGYGSSWAE